MKIHALVGKAGRPGATHSLIGRSMAECVGQIREVVTVTVIDL
jgi:hypothetical protein